MSCGKYSPTVTESYCRDQDWWDKHHNPDDDSSLFDADGFDSYGYNAAGVDRAGHREEDYLGSGQWIDDEYCYPLYEEVAFAWRRKIIHR